MSEICRSKFDKGSPESCNQNVLKNKNKRNTLGPVWLNLN